MSPGAKLLTSQSNDPSREQDTSESSHPEADFVEALHPKSVLDAGCGTGRVAIELARRGIGVVGVDIDPGQLGKAQAEAPHLAWHLGDLATLDLRRKFDVIVMAGNVMIFLAPGTEGPVLTNMARHLAPAGRLVTGFHLSMGYLELDDYDRLAKQAGLGLVRRYSSWQADPWYSMSNYVVSVHESVHELEL
jgi:SAM-dependent methyltransferase